MNDVDDRMAIVRRNQREAPVMMVALAMDLGINVYRVQGWPSEVSGRVFRSLEKGGTSGLAIEVNASHSEPRRRFTIAHEIAHTILHPSYIGYVATGSDDALYDDAMYRSGLSNVQEAQANNLAAKILMPDHLVKKFGPEDKWDVAAMARRFAVSEQAMGIRLGVFA